ncbi:uncharacterized protein LOC135334634 [Halichondria panicea]|uniref:uncharacterized protein LOC135334634 n=1 Tax=Halichondria panicea TaxID=6063 RepID=UPI00312B7FBC
MFTLSVTISSLLLLTLGSQLAESCPCHTRRATVMSVNPTNASVAIIDVISGIEATNRLVGSTIVQKIPQIVYDVDNLTRPAQEVMSSLATLQQYVTMITTLQNSGLNSTELELYKLLLHAILKDSCEWLNSYEGVSIDCTEDLEHFIPVLLSLGLRNELKKIECYLKGFPVAADIKSTPDIWVDREIEPQGIRCGFCNRKMVNLHCPSCQADK